MLECSSYEKILTANVCQQVSKYLKKNRHSSHPERELGLGSTSSQTSSDSSEDFEPIIVYVQNTISIFRLDRFKSDAAKYFFVCLLIDVLKSRVGISDCTFIPFCHSLTNIILTYMQALIDNSIYFPLVLKVLLALRVIVGRVGEISWSEWKGNEPSVVLHKWCQICSLLYISLSSQRPTSVKRDDNAALFISNEGHSYLFSSLCSSIIHLGNILIKLTLEPSSAQRINFEVITFCLEFIRNNIFNSVPELQFLTSDLCSDDKQAFDFLLFATEFQLRLRLTVLQTNSSMNEDLTRTYRILEETIERQGIDIGTLFLLMVTHLVCWDVSVLIDFLCSNETSALKFVLRTTKYLASRPDSFHRALYHYVEPNYDQLGSGDEVRLFLNQRNASTPCINRNSITAVTWTESTTASGVMMGWTVSPSEWHHNACPMYVSSSSNQLSETYSEISHETKHPNNNVLRETRIKLSQFMTETIKSLESKHNKSLLPFNPQIICERLRRIHSGILH